MLRTMTLTVLLLAAPAAMADVPAFLDGAVMDRLCAQLRATDACPECKCDAITQSNPTPQWTENATSIPTGVLVLVSGATAAGAHVKKLHAILGTERKLVDGGVVADLSVNAGVDAKADFQVPMSQRHYDMCSDACRHTAVGAIHLFEVEVSRDERTALEKEEERHHSRTRMLVSCFEENKVPVCYGTTIGFQQRRVFPKRRQKAKPMRGWSRSWKVGGKLGTQLVVGPLRGAGARAARKEAVGRAPRASFFHQIGKRGDTVRLTAAGSR